MLCTVSTHWTNLGRQAEDSRLLLAGPAFALPALDMEHEDQR